MKKLLVVIVIVVTGMLAFINMSSMFSDMNCTAAKLHEERKLVKIQLMIARDYASRSDLERLAIQVGCKLKL